MSVLSDFEDWRENPEFTLVGPAYSDYTGFYIGITIVTIFGLGIILLNLVLCCCSPYKSYWRDPNTGNRHLSPSNPNFLRSSLATSKTQCQQESSNRMLFPLYPPVAIIALLIILLILIILIYGDKVFARVRTQTERIAVRARPSLEPMMRMGSGGRYAPQQQFQHQQPPPQQVYEQRYSPQEQRQQQQQQRFEAPMELQKQSTTYGHREIEV